MSKRIIKSHKGGRELSGRFRLTPDEKQRLDAILTHKNLSLADYIMACVKRDELEGESDE